MQGKDLETSKTACVLLLRNPVFEYFIMWEKDANTFHHINDIVAVNVIVVIFNIFCL